MIIQECRNKPKKKKKKHENTDVGVDARIRTSN